MSLTNKLGSIEAIFLIMIVTVNHIILNLPKAILETTSSASIINIIFISIITLLFVSLICKLLKNFPGLDILDISEYLGGKTLKYVIGMLFIIYFLLCSSIFIRAFAESMKTIYFPKTPIGFIIIVFILAAIICNRLGGNAIIRSSIIFIPLVLASIIFIFLANVDNFTLERVLPLWGNGVATTFFSGISNLFAFGGIIFLYFLPPHLKETAHFSKIALTSTVLSGIWVLLSVSTLLFIFPSVVTTEEVLPLYFASRFIEFGRFFQRIDAIFLLVWIISMTSYISIALFFITSIFKKISSIKYTDLALYGFATIVFIISLLPQNSAQIQFLENEFYKYAVLSVAFIISLVVLLLAFFKKHKKVKGDVVIE